MTICLGGLVTYYAQSGGNDVTMNDAYWFASGIVFCSFYATVTFHPFFLYTYKTAHKIKVACSGLIYQKSLRILRSSTEEGQNGKIINLLANDAAKLDEGLPFFFEVWRGCFEGIIFFTAIYLEIGVAAVAGILFLISITPVQGRYEQYHDIVLLLCCSCIYSFLLFKQLNEI